MVADDFRLSLEDIFNIIQRKVEPGDKEHPRMGLIPNVLVFQSADKKVTYKLSRTALTNRTFKSFLFWITPVWGRLASRLEMSLLPQSHPSLP